MSWYQNLKISVKLLSAFIIVAMIAGVIGYEGVTKLHEIDDADTKLYEKITVPLSDLGDISTAFQRQRVNARDIITATTQEEKQKFATRIKAVSYTHLTLPTNREV